VEGDTIVGAALGVQFPDAGWIRLLGVRPAWRRRRIATALLRTAFGEFWRRGYARVELGVDPHSLYGAQRMYEHAGMRMAFELAKYQKELPMSTFGARAEDTSR
jgi:ribosomal protein S18 acetylase RimI-like enzyme